MRTSDASPARAVQWPAMLRYLLACAAFLVVAWWLPWTVSSRFYRFDRVHMFLPTFYSVLFLAGVTLGVHRVRSWGSCAWLGAGAGLLAGWIAQLAVMLVMRRAWPASAEAGSVAISLAIGSVVWLTPAWGALAAWAAYRLGSRETGR